MEKLNDATVGALADEAEKYPDAIYIGKVVAPLASDLLQTRADLAAARETLRMVCDLCDHADFSNGVEAFGIDEGRETANKILAEARKLLPLPPKEGTL